MSNDMDMHQIAQRIAYAVTEQLRSETDRASAQLAEDREALADTLRREAQNMSERTAARLEDVQAEGVRALETATEKSVERGAQEFVRGAKIVTDRALEALRTGSDAAAALIAQRTTALEEMLEQVTGAVRDLAEATERAERAKAEADKATEAATAEREKAEKAAAFLKLKSELEVERMTETVAYERRKKLTLQELAAQQADLDDGYDRREAAVEAGLQQYYPELVAQLEHIANTETKEA